MIERVAARVRIWRDFGIRMFTRSELKKPKTVCQRLKQESKGVPVEHVDDTVGQGVEPVQADGVVVRGKPFAPNTEPNGRLVFCSQAYPANHVVMFAEEPYPKDAAAFTDTIEAGLLGI